MCDSAQLILQCSSAVVLGMRNNMFWFVGNEPTADRVSLRGIASTVTLRSFFCNHTTSCNPPPRGLVCAVTCTTHARDVFVTTALKVYRICYHTARMYTLTLSSFVFPIAVAVEARGWLWV